MSFEQVSLKPVGSAQIYGCLRKRKASIGFPSMLAFQSDSDALTNPRQARRLFDSQ